MHIFLDEAGTFARAVAPGSWSVVAALAVPEARHADAKEMLRRFKVGLGRRATDEVKRRDMTEEQYFDFLERLGRLEAIGVAVATDAGFNGEAGHHKEQQARMVEVQAPEMIYPDGRLMLESLAADIRRLSDQNYIELYCRTYLVQDVIQLARLYYVQRVPGTLAAFRWQFDRKDIRRNHFEATLRNMVAPLLQSMSLRDPGIFLEGADYSRFERFAFHGEAPWLPEPENPRGYRRGRFNVGRVWYEHLSFVDSAENAGVQLADLLVSGLRCLLRGEFKDNNAAAELLGRCMVGRGNDNPGLRMIALGSQQGQSEIDETVSRRVMRLHRNAKAMLVAGN